MIIKLLGFEVTSDDLPPVWDSIGRARARYPPPVRRLRMDMEVDEEGLAAFLQFARSQGYR